MISRGCRKGEAAIKHVARSKSIPCVPTPDPSQHVYSGFRNKINTKQDSTILAIFIDFPAAG